MNLYLMVISQYSAALIVIFILQGIFLPMLNKVCTVSYNGNFITVYYIIAHQYIGGVVCHYNKAVCTVKYVLYIAFKNLVRIRQYRMENYR